MQLSSLIGKKIISPSGEQLGYVTGAYLSRDLRSLAALIAVDGEEEEFLLPTRAVSACSDAIIAAKARVSSVCGVPAPIGVHAFSEKGDDLGVVGDWLFGDCDPVFILVKDGVRTGYAADSVASEENVVVYLSGERPKPQRRAKRPAKKPSAENDGSMSEAEPTEPAPEVIPAAPAAAEAETAEEAASAPPIPAPPQTAQRGGVQYELGGRNLLGKRVVRSVYDAHGEIVALAGDRITPEILSRARKKGRLLALTVNTLTNVY